MFLGNRVHHHGYTVGNRNQNLLQTLGRTMTVENLERGIKMYKMAKEAQSDIEKYRKHI